MGKIYTASDDLLYYMCESLWSFLARRGEVKTYDSSIEVSAQLYFNPAHDGDGGLVTMTRIKDQRVFRIQEASFVTEVEDGKVTIKGRTPLEARSDFVTHILDMFSQLASTPGPRKK